MLQRLFPPVAANPSQGHKAALWLLGTLLVIKALMGANAIFIGRYIAVRADGIPIDTYPPAAANAVLALFAAWGLGQLMLVANGAIMLVRYRRLVPLVYLLLLAEHVGRRMIFNAMPIAGHPGAAKSGLGPGLIVNYALLLLLVVGFLLSLWKRSADPDRQ